MDYTKLHLCKTNLPTLICYRLNNEFLKYFDKKFRENICSLESIQYIQFVCNTNVNTIFLFLIIT